MRQPWIDRRLTDEQSDLVARNAGLLGLVVSLPRLARLAEALGDEAEAKSIATRGLMRAAQIYDPSKGRFSTFAVRCMQSYLVGAVRQKYRECRRLPEGHSVRALDDTCDQARPFDGFDAVDRADLWKWLTRSLPPRQRRILTRRAQGASVREIGDELGISGARASQLENRAIAKLRARAGVD